MIAILLVTAAWLMFPFTRKTWRNKEFRLPKLPQRKPKFDVFPFVLGFHIEMESGSNIRTSLARALEIVPQSHLLTLRSALADGSNLNSAIHHEAKQHKELSAVAIAVGIAETTGAPLGNIIKNLSAEVLQVRNERSEIQSELAATKATIVILAALPMLGLGMGFVMGAHPLHWLGTTSIGKACLLVAVVLEVAGFLWVRRLVTKASQ